jgi:hypothetical protein
MFDLTGVPRVAVDDAGERTLKVGNGEDCDSLRTRFKSALVMVDK